MWLLCDKKGTIIAMFPSKNQAEKYKKKLKDGGYVGTLVIEEKRC